MVMSSQEAAVYVHDILAAGVSGDLDRAASLLTELVKDSTAERMLGICYAFADAGHKALRHHYGDQAPTGKDGNYWALEPLTPDMLDEPGQVFATRFLVAWCNDDRKMACALFEAALITDIETFVNGVYQLVADVIGLIRGALDGNEAGG
jgi:hypothetical protein